MRRIIISAIGSGSGKTIITCGLLKALKNRGLAVRAFKCGPDYIDPMFHSRVVGVPSENLDTFFCDKKQIEEILLGSYTTGSTTDNGDKRITADIDTIQVIEGAMGIYDGLGGVSKKGSVYELASETHTPIILIVNAKGMGPTIISLIKGILADDKEKLIKGIILNNISSGYYNTIYPVLEKETGVKVIGYVPKLEDVSLDSRHLGLKLPEEIYGLTQMVDKLATQVEATIKIDELIKISTQAANIEYKVDESSNKSFVELIKKLGMIKENTPSRIAVARDEVFCFYYEENLRQLKNAGAELVYFSPLHDEILPNNITGILLGGGYPELRLAELEANKSMRISIKSAIENGMPSIAECGGFMYLHDCIVDDSGVERAMVGVIKGKCYNTGKLCRFGYVDLQVGDFSLKGHEFHYYDSTCAGADAIATKPISGLSYEWGYVGDNHIWGYPHLYYASAKNVP